MSTIINFLSGLILITCVSFGGLLIYDTYQGRTLAATLAEAILQDIMKLKESTCQQ
tara:strand:+ start:487 stop:654 length:168 start_codon:yes stop_codon:yes gene_type:complete